MTAVFEADSIGCAFGDRRVLTAASIAVHAGSITVLFGRNGCGKSTLLRAMLGYVTPEWGACRLHGRVIRRPRLHRLARAGVFFVPERELLARNRTVRAHFIALRRAFGETREEDAIARLHIGDLLDRYPHQLSGGERRRAEFALAFARTPICLLADEPFQGIAPRDAEVIATALREMAQNRCAILVTGHEVVTLLALAAEIVWMVAGTTHRLGSPADAALHDQFRREYLGPTAPR